MNRNSGVYLVFVAMFCFNSYGQSKKAEILTFAFSSLTMEMVLDSVSEKTGYFFSYNSEVLPKGSKYSLEVENEPLDEFLTTLLTGTGLRFSIYKDQIILNYEPIIEPRTKKFFSISGIVTDEDDRPVQGANVFLDGTTIGTFTDSSGVYNIFGIPPGIYDLVISHVGYSQSSNRVSEYGGASKIINAVMVPEITMLQEVEIVARKIKRSDIDWIIYYEFFKTELLGNSRNADACVIENPEVLFFLYDEDTETLSVSAREPIVIRNDALGYRINYFLESFVKSPEDLKYRGKLRFRNIAPTNKAQIKSWKRGRKKSYLGSYSHFKRALLDKELRREGFRIYSLKGLGSFKRDEFEALEESDLLVYKGDHYDLSFKNYLLVEYKREKESDGFLNQSDFVQTIYQERIDDQGILHKLPGNQISVLGLLKNKTRVGLEGQVMDKFALTSYGYWAWERVADLVPSNYDPKYKRL